MPRLPGRRFITCGIAGLIVLVLLSGACSATHAFAAPYATGWYYPYWPWYWGGLYYHYPWVEHHYVVYHGGYTPQGRLASGYHYDSSSNVILNSSGQPVYPNSHAVNDIKPSGGAPDPHTLSNAPPAIKAASGTCSGQNSCTGGGNAITNKSGGSSSGGAAGCSGQSSCTGGGNAVTNKSGGAGSASEPEGGQNGSGGAVTNKSAGGSGSSAGSAGSSAGSSGAHGSNGSKPSSSGSGSGGAPKSSGSSRSSGSHSSSGSSHASGGGSHASGGHR